MFVPKLLTQIEIHATKQQATQNPNN